jgi:hypothetical protein
MPAQAASVFSEKFPHQTFETITAYGPAYLATDGDAESAGAAGFFQDKNNEMGSLEFFSPFPDFSIFPSPPKAKSRGKTFFSARPQGDYLLGMVTERFFRPLERRRLRTIRPFLVCIRLRKPWVLFRRILLG